LPTFQSVQHKLKSQLLLPLLLKALPLLLKALRHLKLLKLKLELKPWFG
jgi:hypothetical protein